MAPETTTKLTPLFPADFHILFALLDGPRHGYAISREIRDETDGAIRLEAANLQRTIGKLVRRGLVEETDWRPAPADDDRRRRYYAVTDRGRRAVVADAARMRAAVTAAEERDLIPRTGDAR